MTTAARATPRRRGIDLLAHAWTRSIVTQALAGEWTPWAAWLGSAFELLPGRRTFRDDRDTVEQWRLIREPVLHTLDELGLEATVLRTHSPVPEPLDAHYAHLAGLVHVHRRDDDYLWTPEIPPWLLLASSPQAQHACRMLQRHQLVPARFALPLQLRAFCGQADEIEQEGHVDDTGWRDHVRAWVTLQGQPVLSVEPYARDQDPRQVVETIRGHIAAANLPLIVDGPHAGAWSETTVLAFLRHDQHAPSLAAVHAPAATWAAGPRRTR